MLRLDINLVFTIINLLVLYFLMKKFLFKPVNNIIAQREEAIKKQFDDADEAQKKGAHAGNLIKAIAGLVGGGGGGRPNMAQAGGKNPAGIEEALKKAVEVVEEQTK